MTDTSQPFFVTLPGNIHSYVLSSIVYNKLNYLNMSIFAGILLLTSVLYGLESIPLQLLMIATLNYDTFYTKQSLSKNQIKQKSTYLPIAVPGEFYEVTYKRVLCMRILTRHGHPAYVCYNNRSELIYYEPDHIKDYKLDFFTRIYNTPTSIKRLYFTKPINHIQPLEEVDEDINEEVEDDTRDNTKEDIDAVQELINFHTE